MSRIVALLHLLAMLPSLALVAPACGAPANADWSAYGGDAGGTRYSPLSEITPANVSELRVAWIYRTGELGQGVKD